MNLCTYLCIANSIMFIIHIWHWQGILKTGSTNLILFFPEAEANGSGLVSYTVTQHLIWKTAQV